MLGVMVWGENNVLRLTLGRGDLWDHRGGSQWGEAMTFESLKECLDADDESRLKSLLEHRGPVPGQPKNPSVISIGRIELHFPADTRLLRAELCFETGMLTVFLAGSGTEECSVMLYLDRDQPLLQVGFGAGCPIPERRLVPAWEHMNGYLASLSFQPPVPFCEKQGDVQVEGWQQDMPADPPCAVAIAVGGRHLHITAMHCAEARQVSCGMVAAAARNPVDDLPRRVAKWWQDYWQTAPILDIPNERLAFFHRYGLWKFAGLWNIHAAPPGLQGCWVEDYQLPPWSNDYHFNINVQMCCWPAFASGKAEMLMPLFDLVWSWRDILRENARRFLGIEDGFILSHAVDDRATIIGGFWAGTIDHACTIWVGLLMMDYWRHTGDEVFLRERALPFLRGAMKVCEKLVERDGDRFSLPVSVSPEFNGSEMNAWGRDASFQLGAYHALIRALHEACLQLGEPADPVWSELERGLPIACVEAPVGRKKLMLWEGQDLTYSHRHHSHWGALYPWDIIEPTDPAWAPVLLATYDWWNLQGMGLWSGWCMPWAAMLHTRIGSPELAEGILELWERIYTNEGHGTLHDGNFRKRNVQVTPLRPPEVPYEGGQKRGEFIQIEAGLAACAAVMDMLMHSRVGVIWLFEGVPAHWRQCGFSGLHAPGGFVLSARWKEGFVDYLSLRSLRGGTVRLSSRTPCAFQIPSDCPVTGDGKTWAVTMQAGETREFS